MTEFSIFEVERVNTFLEGLSSLTDEQLVYFQYLLPLRMERKIKEEKYFGAFPDHLADLSN